MFRDCINKPIDPIPVEYVKQLKRPMDEPDYSLTCLGIALLKSRIDDYGGIDGVYHSFTDEITCARDFIERAKTIDTYPTFCYYTYDYSAEDQDEVKEVLKSGGFEIKDTIGALLKEKAGTKCLAVYHPVMNCAAVIINTRDMRFYHMLISFMSLFFPTLFKYKPLETQDYNIIKALSKTDKDTFIQQIQVAVTPYLVEFRQLMLGSLLKNMHAAKIRNALSNVENQRSNIQNIEREYAEAMKYLKELIVTYEGMKATESFDKPEEDLVDYLAKNKDVRNLTMVGNKLSFTVATLLNNYNENAWKTFSNRGYIYDGNYTHDGRHNIVLLDVFKERENRKLLLDNIFSESPEFAVKIAGNYTLDFDYNQIRTSKTFDYAAADPIYKSYMPNPHLKIFSCLGGYEARVNRALKDRNYIGAIEMCWASAGSVDLDETEQTFRPFIGWLMMSREKVLRRKDGVDMTPEEALLYLIDKEKAK